MTEVASAYVTLLPTAKGFGQGISAQIDPSAAAAGRSAGKKIGDGIATGTNQGTREAKKGIDTLTAAVAGGGILLFAKGAIAQAEEAQKVSAQTAAVIKSTGGAAKITAGQVGDLANAISDYAGIDDEAIQAGENMLLTFTNIRNEVGKGNDIFTQATKTVTDMSVALGQDMKSSAIQLGKALNDPVKGVTALQRVGVTFTAQQKEQIKALVAHNNTLGAQKLILAELNKEFGGSAAAQATGLDKLNVAWKNFEEVAGGAIQPIIEFTAEVAQVLLPALAQLSPILLPLAATILVVAGATKAWAVAQTLLDIALTDNPIGLIVVAIAALVITLVWAWNKFSGFRDFVKEVGRDISIAWSAFTGAMVAAWNASIGWLTARWNGFTSWLKGVWNGIKGAWNGFTSGLTAIWNGFVGRIMAIWNGGISKINAVLGTLGGVARSVIGGIAGFFGGVASKIDWVIGKIRDLIGWIGKIHLPSLGSIGSGIGHLFGLAGGGDMPDGVGWVGEQGPELVQKNGSQVRVLSHSNSVAKAGASGGSVVVNLGGVTVRDEKDALTLAREIGRETARALRAMGQPVPLTGVAG